MEQEKTAGSASASPQEERSEERRQVTGKLGGQVAEEIGKANEIYKEIYGI